jgi:hypothetical protein
MEDLDQPAIRGLIRSTTRKQTRTKSIKIPQKAFEVAKVLLSHSRWMNHHNPREFFTISSYTLA